MIGDPDTLESVNGPRAARTAMKIPKPSDEDKAYFTSIVPEAPGVETRPMFGNIAAFVNGNMFMGLFASAVGVRLGEDDRKSLLSEAGATGFGPADRPMKEYVSMPPAWRADSEQTALWVDRALAHTGALPEKTKKNR